MDGGMHVCSNRDISVRSFTVTERCEILACVARTSSATSGRPRYLAPEMSVIQVAASGRMSSSVIASTSRIACKHAALLTYWVI